MEPSPKTTFDTDHLIGMSVSNAKAFVETNKVLHRDYEDPITEIRVTKKDGDYQIRIKDIRNSKRDMRLNVHTEQDIITEIEGVY